VGGRLALQLHGGRDVEVRFKEVRVLGGPPEDQGVTSHSRMEVLSRLTLRA
jgi:hypothetical protein